MKIHTTPEAFAQLQPQWRAWRTFDPYLDPLWYQSWWESFGADHQLLLLELPEPTPALLPLMQTSSGQLQFVGNIYSHRQGIAAGIEDQRPIWETFLAFVEEQLPGQSVDLRHLPSQGPEAQALRGLLDESWDEQAEESESWAIPKGHSWEQHLQGQGRESRRKRRRLHRRLEAFGDLQLHQATSPDEARLFVREYSRILVASWKAPESRSFFRKIAEYSAKEGWFCSYTLRHDELPIACQMGFFDGHTYFCYKTAYHQQYAALWPGIAVMDLAFQDLAERGPLQLDLLTGDDPYKQLWCNHSSAQSRFSYGPIEAQPEPPSPQGGPELLSLSCTQSDLLSHPLPEGSSIRPIAQESPLRLAVAMGSSQVKGVEELLQNPDVQGWLCIQDEKILDLLWLRADGRLYLASPKVRVSRDVRRGFLSQCLQRAEGRATQGWKRVSVEVERGWLPVLGELGFVEDSMM